MLGTRLRIGKDELGLTLDLAALNVVADGLWTPSVDLAASGESSAENFLHGTLEILGHRLIAHRSCDLNDLVEGNRLGVLDVLLFLPVSRWLFERPNDQRRSGWDDGDGSLTILDGKLDGNS